MTVFVTVLAAVALCLGAPQMARAGILRTGGVVAWGGNYYGETSVPASASNNVIAVSGGGVNGEGPEEVFSLALKRDGTVVGWGANYYGEINIPGSVSNAVAIAAGGLHALALLSNGSVIAWGNDDEGQIDVPAGLTNVISIAAGFLHSLALKSDGTVVTWGYNEEGQIGVPSDLSNVVAIAAGMYHSLAVKSDGTVVAWGENQDGQTDVPAGLSNVVAVAAGFAHSMALKSDGTVVAWGADWLGQIDVPAGLSNVVAIAAGSLHSLALKSDGTVAAWGINWDGETNVPGSLTNAFAIAAGGDQGLAIVPATTIDTPPTISCPNASATLYSSNGTPVNVTVHVHDADGDALQVIWRVNGADYQTNSVSAGVGVTDSDVSLTTNFDGFGAFTIYASVSDGLTNAVSCVTIVNIGVPGPLVAWGDDSFGQSDVPTTITNAVAVAGGSAFSLALLADGTVVGWGTNDLDEITIPAGATNVVAISASSQHSLALLADGTVLAWGGDNHWGEITVPAGATNIVAIAAGGNQNIALASDGTLFIWGYSYYGLPTPPDGLSNIVNIAASSLNNGVLLADGTIAVWGYGDGGETNAVPGATNVVAISLGPEHGLALRRDGTIVGWGYDYFGQADAPASATNVVAIMAGAYYSTILHADRSVTSWGFNCDYSIVVPDGLLATAIASGDYHQLAVGVVIPPNHAPTVTCSDDVVTNAASSDGVELSVGAEVADADGDALQVTWTVNDSLVQTINVPASSGGATDTNLTFSTTFLAGTNTVVCTVTDTSSASANCQFQVIVTQSSGVLLQIEESLGDVLALLGDATGKNASNKLDRISQILSNATLDASWDDVNHPDVKKGRGVFRREIRASEILKALLHANSSGVDTSAVHDVISELVAAARQTAVIAITDAQDRGGSVKRIAAANALLAKGDALASTNPTAAIARYRAAWGTAMHAGSESLR